MRLSEALNRLSRSGMHTFTTYDIAKLIGKPTSYASLLLSKSKNVSRIERGKYFVEGATVYEIASNVIFPSYVSLSAGLQYYGLIDQNIVKYSVIALKRHKAIRVRNAGIEFIKTKKKMFFGYINRSNAYVATPEKLIIDCLYFGKVPFYVVKEAFEAASREGLVNKDKLEKYAIKTGNSALASKLGFLLSLEGITSDKLLKHRYYNYIHIKGIGRKGTNRKWMVKYD